MLLQKISKKVSYVLASIVLMTAQMTPFFVLGGQRAAAVGGDPESECSALGLLYLDKIDEIKDDNDNDDAADGDYVSDEGYTYYVDVDDNPNPTPSTYTLDPGPESSGYYDLIPNIDLESIVHFGKFGNGGGLSHITMCYAEESETGSITIKKNAISDSNQAFKFSTNGLSTDVSGFELIDDTTSGLPEKVFSEIDSGIYVVEELDTSGWYLDDISCSSDLGSGIVEEGGKITITLKQGDNVSCVFVNRQSEEPETGVLIVKKVLNKYGDRAEKPSDFSFRVDGGEPVQFISSGYNTAENKLELPLGIYTVVEVEEDLNNYKTEYEGCKDIEIVVGEESICTITNTDTLPLLSVTKNVVNDDGFGTNMAEDFDLFVNDELLDDPRKGGGDIEYSSVTYLHPNTVVGVSYSVTESNKPNYIASEVSCYDTAAKLAVNHPVVLVAGQHVVCEITNNDQRPPVTIVATKIVCDDELLLPNWGTGIGENITSLTAIDWVTDNEGCELAEGWNFEYAFNNAVNPGDNLGNTAWTDFEPTGVNGQTSVEFDDVSDVNRIWIREQLKDGYLGFTFNANNKTNIDAISAELYCHTDVLNYDNYDFIDNPMYGNTYYCVAWNVAEKGRVEVTKFNDKNNNGEWDDDEETLPDWEMVLTPRNECVAYTVLDSDEDDSPVDCEEPEPIELDTNQDGVAIFENVKSGWYTVGEDDKAGWDQTVIYCDDDRLDYARLLDVEEETREIWVGAGQTVKCYIGNYDTPGGGGTIPKTGTIIVTKFNDLDNDGIKDAGEPNLQGWEIIIEGQGVKLTGLTGPDGTVTFSNLKLGSYKVSEVLQNGWVQTVNYCEDNSQNECVVGAEEPVGCFIGNYKPGVVLSGTTPPTSKPQVLGVTTLATTGDNQGSFAFITGLTLIAATLLTVANRKRETISTK